MALTVNDVTRRQFLGRATRAASVMSLVGVWSQCAAATPNSPNEQLDIAAVGVGNRGADNLAAVKSENIVALCDVDERYLERQRQQFPQARLYRDFRKLLDQERSLDALLISTPDHTHAACALPAMERGLHVYCEKPLARTVDEVRQMAERARRSGVVTQMGNQHHSSTGYQQAVQLVQSGALGAVREVHVWTNRPLWPQGVERPEQPEPVPSYLDWNLWLGPAAKRPYHSGYHPFAWRGWWDFGAGALGDMGPHLLDPVCWALQLDYPTTIEARHSGVNEETAPQWSVVQFDFAARDHQPSVRLTWYDGGQRPPAEITGTPDPPANGALLLGERAKLFLPELGGRPLVISSDGAARPQAPPKELPPGPDHYAQWIEACKQDGTTGSNFIDAARLTETCLLGNVAIRAGGRIEWDAQAARVSNNLEANRFLRSPWRSW